MNEMVYKATVESLMEKFNGEINPAVSVVAKVLGEHHYKLTSDPNFYRRTTGNKVRRILIPQLAEYLLTRK